MFCINVIAVVMKVEFGTLSPGEEDDNKRQDLCYRTLKVGVVSGRGLCMCENTSVFA